MEIRGEFLSQSLVAEGRFQNIHLRAHKLETGDMRFHSKMLKRLRKGPPM